MNLKKIEEMVKHLEKPDEESIYSDFESIKEEELFAIFTIERIIKEEASKNNILISPGFFMYSFMRLLQSAKIISINESIYEDKKRNDK